MLKYVLFNLAALISQLTSLSPAAAQECISYTADAGAVYGTADFTGDPWVLSWVVDQDWNNDKGEWVSIDPITHELAVPGQAIEFRFNDGTKFIYGAEQAPGAKADNLFTIRQYGYDGEPGPYQAIRTVTGEIFLLDEDRCEPVSWNLAH